MTWTRCELGLRACIGYKTDGVGIGSSARLATVWVGETWKDIWDDDEAVGAAA